MTAHGLQMTALLNDYSSQKTASPDDSSYQINPDDCIARRANIWKTTFSDDCISRWQWRLITASPDDNDAWLLHLHMTDHQMSASLINWANQYLHLQMTTPLIWLHLQMIALLRITSPAVYNSRCQKLVIVTSPDECTCRWLWCQMTIYWWCSLDNHISW